ncbi:MAG: ABC transporter permease [Paracoccaceae bacterium]
MEKMPRWADLVLIPLINLTLALVVSGLVVLFIGEDPINAMKIMVKGAVGSTYGWGYTLFYATNFVFTGLAVAVAFHARLFNIGGEGQALLGSLGVAVVCLYVPWPHWLVALPFAIIGGAAFGAGWAAIPAYLQAKRGSHIVITTIMFNFIASALLVYLLVNVMKMPGQMSPETARFGEGTFLPKARDMLAVVGIPFARTPLNFAFVVAIVACVLVWLLIWRTRLGFEIRAYGQSETAANYAGISALKITMIAMLISGALAGLMAVNAVMGEAQRLTLDSIQGAGFVGIAVALMGRSHPVGVFLAAILFGALYQGGAELEFDTSVPREMVVVIQALVILFTGALDNMVRRPLEQVFLTRRRKEA